MFVSKQTGTLLDDFTFFIRLGVKPYVDVSQIFVTLLYTEKKGYLNLTFFFNFKANKYLTPVI